MKFTTQKVTLLPQVPGLDAPVRRVQVTPSGRWWVIGPAREGWRVMHRAGFSILPPFQWSAYKARQVAGLFEGIPTPNLDAIQVRSQFEAADVAVSGACRVEVETLRAAGVRAGLWPGAS